MDMNSMGQAVPQTGIMQRSRTRPQARRRAAPGQLALPWNQMLLPLDAPPAHAHPEAANSETRMRAELEQAIGAPVKLVLTDNSTSLISARRAAPGFSMRVHRIFTGAGAAVIHEMAAWVRGRATETPLFWEFFRRHKHLLPPRAPRRVTVTTTGEHHDLAEVFERLNGEYFQGRLACTITWGTRASRRRVRTRTLGSYSAHTDMIRINPTLDSRRVPGYYVEYIVHHEMAHAWVRMESPGGKASRPHGPEFKAVEARYRDLERALAWEKQRREG
jgi:predicted SprT family Zn-dependent metalloprotease